LIFEIRCSCKRCRSFSCFSHFSTLKNRFVSV
jgi:hypothetical protein